MAEITGTEKNFEAEVLQSAQPVLVDFWAEWCGPCRMVGPILSEIASEYAGEVKVVKVNVDEQQSLAMRYQVAVIPTLLLFRNGEPERKATGYHEKEELKELLLADL